MKIAIGLTSMFLGLLVLLQSCTVGTASHMLGEQATADAGAVGMLVGVLYFVGGAFSFGLPAVAMVVFAVASLLALAAGASGNFSDMTRLGRGCAHPRCRCLLHVAFGPQGEGDDEQCVVSPVLL